jgi:hypothetical protein
VRIAPNWRFVHAFCLRTLPIELRGPFQGLCLCPGKLRFPTAETGVGRDLVRMLSQCDGKPSISRCLDHASMLDRAIARSQVKLIEQHADESAKSPVGASARPRFFSLRSRSRSPGSAKRNNMWVISFFLRGPAIDAWPSYPAVIMREGSRRISPSGRDCWARSVSDSAKLNKAHLTR